MDILYHGSMYSITDGVLMPGFKRSGELVEWDKTESNEWLYAIGNKSLAETLGVFSALEKKYNVSRCTIVNKVVYIESATNLTNCDIGTLDVYIYTIDATKNNWVLVNNEFNRIQDEYKTKDTVTPISSYKLNVNDWLRDKRLKVKIISDVTLESNSFKPNEIADGWYEIPNHDYHLANRAGELKNRKTGYVTKGSADDRGYLRVCTWDNDAKKKKDFKSHVLICSAFHGPRPDGHEVGHLDDNRANNRANNLVWITRLENMRKRHSLESASFKW